MKILYIHQYFKTPQDGGKTRSYEIAKQLVKNGNEVTMITSWNKGTKEEKYIDGIQVIYLPVTYKNEFSSLYRIWSFIKFQIKAISIGKNLDKPDIIYATSTPLTVGSIGFQLAKSFNCPWVFEVRDLWPEAPIQLGVFKSKWLKNHLYRMEMNLLTSANEVIALSPFSVNHIKKITSKKPNFIPNLCNNEYFKLPTTSIEPTNKFRIGYFGAISTANGLESFIALAEYAKDQGLDQYEFLLLGEGKSKKALIHRSKHLKNISFLPEQNKKEITKTILTCQASYISFIDVPILQSCSPNKFFDSIASGRFIVTNTTGWIRELIEKNECGFYANSPRTFFEKIKPFTTSKMMLQKAQINAKNLAINEFDKTVLINKIEKLLSGLVKK